MICSETIELSSCSRGQDHLDKDRKAGSSFNWGIMLPSIADRSLKAPQVRPGDRQLRRLPSRDQAMLARSPRNLPRPGSTGERSGESRHWIALVIVHQASRDRPSSADRLFRGIVDCLTSRTGHGSLKQGFRRRQTHHFFPIGKSPPC